MITRTNFIYDPERQGYDTTLWKSLVGTPTVGIFDFVDTDGDDIDIDIPFDTLLITESVTIALT